MAIPDLWFASGYRTMTSETFTNLKEMLLASLQVETLYVRDVLAGADPTHFIRIRVITNYAWQNIAASNMFIRNHTPEPHIDPDFTLLVSSKFEGDPAVDGLRSPAMVALNFDEKLVLIGKTLYGGEIKKSVFTLINTSSKTRCSLFSLFREIGEEGDVSLFLVSAVPGKPPSPP